MFGFDAYVYYFVFFRSWEKSQMRKLNNRAGSLLTLKCELLNITLCETNSLAIYTYNYKVVSVSAY